MTAISRKQRARFYMYKKQKKYRMFLYTKRHTLYQKQDNSRCVFMYKKQDTLRYAVFMKILKLEFVFKKHDTLRYVTFYIQTS